MPKIIEIPPKLLQTQHTSDITYFNPHLGSQLIISTLNTKDKIYLHEIL